MWKTGSLFISKPEEEDVISKQHMCMCVEGEEGVRERVFLWMCVYMDLLRTINNSLFVSVQRHVS